MTKRDFRTRRQLFKGSIRRHRDFESFQTSYRGHKRQQRASRLILFILLFGVIFLSFYLIVRFF